MTGQEAIELIGFERARPINSKSKLLIETESVVINELREKNFGVDLVYFNVDENAKSHPAVFFKRVELFDEDTFKEISEVHRKAWNYKKVLFLYVYSDTEIRIYNCSERPVIKASKYINYEEELRNIEIEAFITSDKEQLEKLDKLFSRIAIDSGIVWTLEEAKFIRDQINLQRRVDKYLVSSLVKTANKLEIQGIKTDVVHKIILRSLFLLYLEDRGATDEKFYSNIKEGAKSYFDILDDVKSTYKLFTRLEEDFNGNVFTVDEEENITEQHLRIVKQCFISGYEEFSQASLFEEWRLFNFSIIQIELLSEIYEKFLAETDDALKEDSGAYYTPPALVEFILNEKLPTKKNDTVYNKRILDPSCGSGIFLVESFKRLVKRYENKHKKKLNDFDQLKKLLTENIFGIELHPQAIKVAAFSLYLALVDNLDPKTLWQKKRLPYLINDPDEVDHEKQGHNLFCRDTIESNKDIESIEFDLVVGNPPFGNRNLLPSIRNYCDNEGFAKEKVLPFLHKATKFSPSGDIALIFNSKILTNTGGTYQIFREWLFNKCYVEKVFNFSILRKASKNHGGQLFGDATGPISIIFYQKEQPPNPSTKIAYYAPKTFIKSNVIDGLSIDYTDIKYLPREECQKPETKLWKIAMWGGMNDWELIKDILKRTTSLKEYLNRADNRWKKPRVGLHGDKIHPDFIPEKIIDVRLIERYYTPESASKPNTKKYRNIDKDIFKAPFVLMKKGQHKKQLAASYIDYFSYCTTACYIFNGNVDSEQKKALVTILNSKLSTYLLFLTSSSWGIEREQVFMDEVLESPALLPLLHQETLSKLVILFDEILSLKKQNTPFIQAKIQEIENEMDNIIIDDVLNSSRKNKTLVFDNLDYSLDLFNKQDKSIALNPVNHLHLNDYVKIISQQVTSFLDGQNLFANSTIFKVSLFTPLMMIKLSFDNKPKEVAVSKESVDNELKKIDQQLWEEKSTNIYFRKKLNYKSGNDIFIIRPNQRRFWSKSMALEDASELILEILNEN